MSLQSAEGFVHVPEGSAMQEGELHQFEIDGRIRVLAKSDDGQIRALDGVCTHEEAELADGDLEGTTLWCPFHAAGFDVDTGAATCLPAEQPLRRYEVRVEDGEVFVAREPLPLP